MNKRLADRPVLAGDYSIAVQKGFEVGREERERQKDLSEDKEAQKILLGQTARN